jgi:signal transduction histidine kinase
VVNEFDVHLRRRDGTMIWVRDTARSVVDGDGNITCFEGALIDVTERRATQEKLTETIRAKDEFVAAVSHELRNPIAAVVGLSEELAEGWKSFSDDIRRELARVIHHQADELAAIVEDLLVASRDEVGELSITKERLDPVSETDLVLEAVEAPVKVIAEPGVDLSVYGDPRRFRQVMRNLIGNAHRYGGDQVEVTIGLGGASINVGVRDDGPGVDSSDAERIFEPYQRANGSNHPSSVGLGLPVARKLARLMGGDVTYARDGEWSVFTLALPRFDSTSA